MASKKGKRYVWQEHETATLLDLYISHKAVLEGPYIAVITKELKKKTWVLLTESLHLEHPDCSEKTVANVKKKWNNFPTAAKLAISNHKQGLTETDGGPSTGSLRDMYMKFWEEILGKDNPTVAGMTIPGSIDSEVVGDGSVVDRSLVELILNSDGKNHEDSSNDDEEMEGGLTQDNDIVLAGTVQAQELNEKNSQLLPFESLEVYPSTSGGSGALKRSSSCLKNRNSSSPVCGSTTETSPRDRLRLEVPLKKPT